MAEDDIYTAPKSELSNEPLDGSKCEFFPTSLRKLVILFIATFGMYTFYWFYKHWQLQKNTGKKVIPILRTIFYIFFTHSLFRSVEYEAASKGISKSWGANRLATGFVILTILYNFLNLPHKHRGLADSIFDTILAILE